MKKIITTEELLHTPIIQLTKYDPALLYDLFKRVAIELESAKHKKEWIEAVIARKYDDQAQIQRIRHGKDTGTVHIEDAGYKIINDIPKKVEWDQKKLEGVAAKIMLDGGNASDYIETTYHVSETKYNSLAAPIRGMLEQARVIRQGKSSYKIIKLNGDEPAPCNNALKAKPIRQIEGLLINNHTDSANITVIDTFTGGMA